MVKSNSRISLPVKRRLVILVVSSLVSCIFFSSPFFAIPSPTDGPDLEIEVPLPEPEIISTVTVTVHAPAEARSTDLVTDLDSGLLFSRITTPYFRDNLQPSIKYITSGSAKDWHNQVIAFTNLLYLSLITERVPIIPPFSYHEAQHTSDLDFGDVFDMKRLKKELEIPILEWYQVKNTKGTSSEILGCWRTSSVRNDSLPNSFPPSLKLDVSFTTAPDFAEIHADTGENFTTFWSLASLAFPDAFTTISTVEDAEQSPRHQVKLPPDHQSLLCFDDLSHVSVLNPSEFSLDISPAWRFVGQHMHWNPRIQHIADIYARKTFGIDTADPIPPYITVHAQHTNAESWCEVPIEDCFAPLSAYAQRVEEVKAEIRSTMGISVERVLVISDKTGKYWWEAVRKRGWVRIDHSGTIRRYGAWYPTLIDAVIESQGIAYVSTAQPMGSVLGGKRVSSWQGGIVKTVPWETRKTRVAPPIPPLKLLDIP
ncbi:hypothetical protein R3P38DRAFT_2924042 [Favolaschia claudopus]|uniref:Uncharacterized protein n=1 Tax=Favolaschia claudopus TaxID=2862362 RepID=A0AAW0BX66_9AGAR